MKVAPGCFFEPEDDIVEDPIVGKKKGSIAFGDTYYRRSTILDSIPDDFENRMKTFSRKIHNKTERNVKVPDGFAVSVAYNKSGYQVIPAKDLNEKV